MAEPDPDQPDTESRPAPREPAAADIFFGADGLRAGWALLLFAVVYNVIGMTLGALLPAPAINPGLFQAPFVLRAEGIGLISVFAATFLMARLEGRPLLAFGLDPRRLPERFLGGAAFGLILLALLVAALTVSGYLVFETRLLHGASVVRFAVEWAFVFLVVALFEENFFRGYLQSTLTRGLSALYRFAGARAYGALGFWTSAVLLSFGFGAVHTQNTGESPIGVAAAGIVGVVFCLSLWRTGSLWWAIGFHAAWDWAQSFLFGVYDSGTLADGRLFQTHPQGPLLLSGGITGPEGSVLVLPTMILIALAILITLPARPRPPILNGAQPEPPVPAI